MLLPVLLMTLTHVDPSGEPRFLELLGGGDLVPVQVPGHGPRLAWWDGAAARQARGEEGVARTTPEAGLRQPLPAFAPLAAGVRVRGQVAGAGVLRVHASRADGRRVARDLALGAAGESFRTFEVELGDLASGPDEVLGPRFELEFLAAPGGEARWRELSAVVPFPAAGVEELREELWKELAWVLDLWLERAADREGPRRTAFLTSIFDVVTGEPLVTIDGGHNVFFDLLFRVSLLEDLEEQEGAERWRGALDAFLADYLELCLHPDTGLPRPFDAVSDVPRDEGGVEIAAQLGFLVDVAEHGPPAYRERALAAARRMAATVLRVGLAPDGGVAAKYRPSDGRPDPHVTHLRRLDLPAQLGRLAALEQGAQRELLLEVAREAAAALEYTLRWPGTWEEVDPGFDDIYGHFGQRASELLAVAPDDPLFRRLSVGGLRHYLPLWHDAVRLGGNVAADQVRCWHIAMDLADLEPGLLPELAPVLTDAGRAHLMGQQYGNGAWGDVTIYRFDPRDHLQVGDLPGVPQNLLQGLAVLHDARLEAAGGLALADVRSLFLGVLEASRAAYRRPYGYLSTRREAVGANPARGSIAVATALVEMLEQLEGS